VRREVASVLELFPDDESAEEWMIQIRWPDGVRCCDCGNDQVSMSFHRQMRWRCHQCRGFFPAKKGTVTQYTKIVVRKWLVAIYLMVANLKGVVQQETGKGSGITQKLAWYMNHRIRKAFEQENPRFWEASRKWTRPMSAAKSATGTTGKNSVWPRAYRQTAVVGAIQRDGKTAAHPVFVVTKEELGSCLATSALGTLVFTDKHRFYAGLRLEYEHAAVSYSTGEYVRGMVNTNSAESFRSLFKQGYYGTYHQMSPKHFVRYVSEFSGRKNLRRKSTVEQMRHLFQQLIGK